MEELYINKEREIKERKKMYQIDGHNHGEEAGKAEQSENPQHRRNLQTARHDIDTNNVLDIEHAKDGGLDEQRGELILVGTAVDMEQKGRYTGEPT